MYIPFLCKDDDKLWEVINNEGYHKTITVKKSPSGRFYLSISLHDPEKDRDQNAAINIKVQGFQLFQKAKTT